MLRVAMTAGPAGPDLVNLLSPYFNILSCEGIDHHRVILYPAPPFCIHAGARPPTCPRCCVVGSWRVSTRASASTATTRPTCTGAAVHPSLMLYSSSYCRLGRVLRTRAAQPMWHLNGVHTYTGVWYWNLHVAQSSLDARASCLGVVHHYHMPPHVPPHTHRQAQHKHQHQHISPHVCALPSRTPEPSTLSANTSKRSKP